MERKFLKGTIAGAVILAASIGGWEVGANVKHTDSSVTRAGASEEDSKEFNPLVDFPQYEKSEITPPNVGDGNLLNQAEITQLR